MSNIIIKPGDRAHDPNAGKPCKEGARMVGVITTVLGKAGVPVNMHNDCLAWAFGPDALYIAPALWPDRWNKLHPRSFRAKRNEKFVEFLYVVGFNYCVRALREGMKNPAWRKEYEEGPGGVR